MQIQCPKCQEWIESTDGICPLCSAIIEQAQTAVDLPKSFYIKKIIKHILLLAFAVLCIIGIVFFVMYIKEPEERWVNVIGPLDETIDGCLPPYDAVTVPKDADDETILKMEQELYQAHLNHTDCRTPDNKPNTHWASRIGSGWLSPKNEQLMAQNPRYVNVLTRDGFKRYDHYKYDNSFMKDYEGCHGFPISTAYDGMRLYVRSPKSGTIEMAFTNNSTQLERSDYTHSEVMERSENLRDAPYTVHTPDKPAHPIGQSVIVSRFEGIPYLSGHVVEPVNRSPILYGIDEEHYTEGTLKQIKDTPYYSFYSGEAVYLNMKGGKVFRVVFPVKYQKQTILLYRVYPLSHDIPTDAQFFDEACKF